MILSTIMIQAYFDTQMKKATYEIIDQGSRFYAEIKTLPGVWATGNTLEQCRENLLATLEGWFILSLKQNLPIPNFKQSGTKTVRREHA